MLSLTHVVKGPLLKDQYITHHRYIFNGQITAFVANANLIRGALITFAPTCIKKSKPSLNLNYVDACQHNYKESMLSLKEEFDSSSILSLSEWKLIKTNFDENSKSEVTSKNSHKTKMAKENESKNGLFYIIKIFFSFAAGPIVFLLIIVNNQKPLIRRITANLLLKYFIIYCASYFPVGTDGLLNQSLFLIYL